MVCVGLNNGQKTDMANQYLLQIFIGLLQGFALVLLRVSFSFDTRDLLCLVFMVSEGVPYLVVDVHILVAAAHAPPVEQRMRLV
jgi:hypothetical protein